MDRHMLLRASGNEGTWLKNGQKAAVILTEIKLCLFFYREWMFNNRYSLVFYQLVPSFAQQPVGCSTSPTPTSVTQVHKYIWKSKPGQRKGKDDYWEDRDPVLDRSALILVLNPECCFLQVHQIQATHLCLGEKCHWQLVWSTWGKHTSN